MKILAWLSFACAVAGAAGCTGDSKSQPSADSLPPPFAGAEIPAGWTLEPVVYRLMLAWPVGLQVESKARAARAPEAAISGLHDRGLWAVVRRDDAGAERHIQVAISEIVEARLPQPSTDGDVNPAPRYAGKDEDLRSTTELFDEYQKQLGVLQASPTYKQLMAAGDMSVSQAYLRREMTSYLMRKAGSDIIRSEKLPPQLHGLELPRVLAVLAALQRVDDDGRIAASQEFREKVRQVVDSIEDQDMEALADITELVMLLALQVRANQKSSAPAGPHAGSSGDAPQQPGGSGHGSSPATGEGRPDTRPPGGGWGGGAGVHETAVNLVVTQEDTPIVERHPESPAGAPDRSDSYIFGITTAADGSHHWRPGEYSADKDGGQPSGQGNPGNNGGGGGNQGNSGGNESDDPDNPDDPKKNEEEEEKQPAETPPPPVEEEEEERDSPMSDVLGYLAQAEVVLDSLLGGGRTRQQGKDLETRAGGDVTNPGDGPMAGSDIGQWPPKVVTDAQGRPILVLQTLAERHAWRMVNVAVETGTGGHADGARAAKAHWADISLLYLDYIELQISGGVSDPPETDERRSAAPERPPLELAPGIAPPQPRARLVVITREVAQDG